MVQQQARALGDPTRHGIFRYLAQADRPVTVAELTEAFGLNHNAIRQHLAKLVEAGLVAETTAKAEGRGRPKLLYAVDPGAGSRWGVDGPYQRLAMLLLEVIATGDDPVEVGWREGQRVEIDTSDPSESPVTQLMKAVAQGGFEPVIVEEGDELDIVLEACPFANAADADSATICALHLGMSQGIADRLDGVSIVGLKPHDPHAAGCELVVRIDPPAPSSA